MTTQPITLELVVGVSERIRDHLIKQKVRSATVVNEKDGMCSRGGGFSYSLWTKGNELHSPEAFHQFITKHYEKEQQSNERA